MFVLCKYLCSGRINLEIVLCSCTFECPSQSRCLVLQLLHICQLKIRFDMKYACILHLLGMSLEHRKYDCSNVLAHWIATNNVEHYEQHNIYKKEIIMRYTYMCFREFKNILNIEVRTSLFLQTCVS